jgi:hypothetical protein
MQDLIRRWTLPARAAVFSVLCTAAVVLAAAPASAATVAGVDPGPAAAAFRAGQHVYVYAGGDALVDAATQAKIKTALSGSVVYLTVLKEPSLGQVQAKQVSDAVAAAAGTRGSYVLLGDVAAQETFLQISSPVLPHIYGTQLRVAIAAHHGDPSAQALALVTALATDQLPPPESTSKPFPWAGVIAGIAVGLIVVVLIVVVWVRQRRRRRASMRRRDDVQAEVDTLADDLLITDPAGRVAIRDVADADPEQRALKVAWSRQQAAAEMLSRTTDRATVDRAGVLARQGRAALEQAQRLRDGVPGESEVLALAAQRGGPDPSLRQDQARAGPSARQQTLQEYTAASYPGYGYGWYPGYGYGFFDYGGSFVTGLLAGELLAQAFDPWGGYGGFGGYDQGYTSGYEQGYDQGQAADPGYGTDTWDDGSADPGYGTDSWGGDGGSFDTGGGSDN